MTRGIYRVIMFLSKAKTLLFFENGRGKIFLRTAVIDPLERAVKGGHGLKPEV